MIIIATPQYHLLEASINTVKSTQFVAYESASVLRDFTRQFRIEDVEDLLDPSPRGLGSKRVGCGAVGFRWREFMENVKPEVLRIMGDNR